MNFLKEKILKNLMKLYGFEVASYKQQEGPFEDKEDQFEALTYYHLNRQISDSINEYIINNNPKDTNTLYNSVSHLLFVMCGDILKQVDKNNKKYANKMLKSCIEHLNKTREDSDNDRFT